MFIEEARRGKLEAQALIRESCHREAHLVEECKTTGEPGEVLTHTVRILSGQTFSRDLCK
jgi:ribosomal protein S28E/S33